MEDGGTLFDAFAAVDPGFAVVELNTADLRHPETLPTYADGYRAFRDLWNAGARFVSPMAWNGSNGAYAGEPGYVSRTAWRSTPLEDAACDFLLARAGLPTASMLWTFGAAGLAEDDGWTAEVGRMSLGSGCVTLEAAAGGRAVLLSPQRLPARIDSANRFVLGAAMPLGLREIVILARADAASAWRRIAGATANEWRETEAGIVVDRDSTARAGRVAQLRVELALAGPQKLVCVAALLSR